MSTELSTSVKETILLGKGRLAVEVAEWLQTASGFQLRTIVPVVPEPTWTQSLSSWADRSGVPVIESGNYRDLPAERCDLAISVFYDKIIDADFISRCRRIINLHNGPLPKYRGVSPINWALKNEERMHGVTLHEITPGIDDGPIIGQVLFPLYPDIDEVEDVYERALRYARVLLETTLPLLDWIPPVPQDESKATYYSRKDDERLGDRRGIRRAGAEA